MSIDVFLSSAAFEVGVFFCTYKNSSSFGISLFFSSTTQRCVAKEEEEEEEEDKEEACSSRLDWSRRVRSPSRIRGEAEANGRAVSARHPVRPQEWRGRGVTQK